MSKNKVPFYRRMFFLLPLAVIAFVILIVLLERSFRVLEVVWPRWALAFPGYAVGSLGAFWTIQRTVMLMGGLR